MTVKSVLKRGQEIDQATRLIRLGARMVVLQDVTQTLSEDVLSRLYREVAGKSPARGLLPYSVDWYMQWRPNLHASAFMAFYNALRAAECSHVEALIRGYEMYLAQVVRDETPELSVTRAWSLLRFTEGQLLHLAPCTQCGGRFVAHIGDLPSVCGGCAPPSRAGHVKTASQGGGCHVE